VQEHSDELPAIKVLRLHVCCGDGIVSCVDEKSFRFRLVGNVP
jgi:hypothetical protein